MRQLAGQARLRTKRSNTKPQALSAPHWKQDCKRARAAARPAAPPPPGRFRTFAGEVVLEEPKAKYPWVLKAGYAMELRMRSGRTTKDIDLTPYDGTRLSKNPKERREEIRGMLQEAAANDLKDYFEFLVGETREEFGGAPEGGSRYPVEARMDGRVSGMKCWSRWTSLKGRTGSRSGTSRRRPFRRSPANSNSRRNSTRFLRRTGSARIRERKI